MPTEDEVRSKVQRILQANLNSVRLFKDSFVVTYNSANVFISVHERFGDDGVVVRLLCPLVREVRLTNDLYRWVAVDGQDYTLGSVELDENEDGRTGSLFFRYALIADDLDESELMKSVLLVAVTSDNLDNELVGRFGGELFGDD